MKYKLARGGVYFSWQGEGHLSGLPMVFLRLAGCSVGCPECDTDYRATGESVSAAALALAVLAAFPKPVRDRWCWITGGEPADRDLVPLVSALSDHGIKVAVATSGSKPIHAPVDWLSVSPHGRCLAQRFGNEIKLVPGLNGLDPFDWIAENPDDTTNFWFRYVQPLDGSEESKAACLAFVKLHPNWGLTVQTHKFWSLA